VNYRDYLFAWYWRSWKFKIKLVRGYITDFFVICLGPLRVMRFLRKKNG
jgi:hypothetical protein